MLLYQRHPSFESIFVARCTNKLYHALVHFLYNVCTACPAALLSADGNKSIG